MARHHAGSASRRSRCVAAAVGLAAALLPAQPAQAATEQVAARGSAFVPASISVQQTAGEAASPAPHGHVIWTNEDPGIEHTVTFEDPRLVSSGRLVTGQTYEAVISVTGTFPYRCTIHPDMTGTVEVTAAAAPAPTVASPGEEAGSGGSAAVVIGLAVAAVASLALLAWLLARRRRRSLSFSGDHV